ncbi:unnamed protein product [Prorocentrum cordatum]|uniref:Uncharacterized protein n=1 Tax=Prorocentrum cordatum TaxID=2364126 RepID=A0ABN9SEG4_9DINO|nr:unnamed protein product [Polarella glacialis]
MWYLIAELLASGVAKIEKLEATAREGEAAGRDERVADGGRPEPAAYAVPARRQARGTPPARPPQRGEDDRGHLALSMSDAWSRLSVGRGAPWRASAGGRRGGRLVRFGGSASSWSSRTRRAWARSRA